MPSGLDDAFRQREHRVRLDWGPVGADAVRADVNVVIDVLSFTTSVTIAVARGAFVYPFAWADSRAAAFAREREATLAVGRLEAARAPGPPPPSLSPALLLEAPLPARLVLPSPNGSTIAARLAESGGEVMAGCLRNAAAVSRHLARALAVGRSVSVVAAGERWAEDNSLRPCLEDHLGAGAVLAGLAAHGDLLSPEAHAAATLFDGLRDDLPDLITRCVGGRELAARGFGEDAVVSAELDADDVVPVLRDGAFVPLHVAG